MSRLPILCFFALCLSQSSLLASHGEISLQHDNDIYFDTDEQYTSGLFFHWYAKDLPIFFELVHQFYTPVIFEEQVEGDHPYAAFGKIGLGYRFRDSEWLKSNLALSAAAMGEQLKAQELQLEFHELIGVNRPGPQHWPSQHFNQEGAQLRYEGFIDTPALVSNFGQIIPTLSLEVGTFQQMQSLGLDLYVPFFNAKLDILGKTGSQAIKNSFHFILRSQVIHVDKNLILEGNSRIQDGKEEHSYGVQPESVYFRFEGELFYQFSDYFSSHFSTNFTSKNYTTQEHHNFFERTSVSKLYSSIDKTGFFYNSLKLSFTY